MADVLVLGGAGELGSNFAKLCVDKGYKVKIIDIVRFNEAWRLKWLGIADTVEYVWKSSFDLDAWDVGVGLILDAACQPDRPLGTSSPNYTLFENLVGPTRLLETVRDLKDIPTILYPSSCNIFLGLPAYRQPIVEESIPKPINYYAWSKLAAEQLYQTYNAADKHMNNIIIRTGSCYGEGMRSDQMIAKCIINMLKNREFTVRSPEARRTFTYTQDVMEFYRKLLAKLKSEPGFLKPFGNLIHNGGNAEGKTFSTMEMAEMIKGICNPKGMLTPSSYEYGEELVDGTPVYQFEKSELAKELLGWEPIVPIRKGLENTSGWFNERLDDYI